MMKRTSHVRLGWAAGAGLEYAFAPHWSARLEYLYSQFDQANIRFPSGTQYTSTHGFPVDPPRPQPQGRLAGLGSLTPKTSLTDPESDRWEIHGQTTYLPQGYPAFRAPYTGPNSLTPAPQAQATWSNSLFLNARLWEGGEVYYNPELLQGFGLNDTVGARRLSNGEAQKSNFPYPHYNTSRLFLRQTFGFGGEQEELASGPTQLGGKVDVSRLTLQAGKFAVTRHVRRQRLCQGHPQGFHELVDLGARRLRLFRRQGRPDLRRHRRVQPEAMGVARRLFPDAMRCRIRTVSTPACLERGNYVLELETRYSLFSQPGKLRTIAWLNSAFSGSYRETLDNPAFNLDIAQTRTGPHQIWLRRQPRTGRDRRHRPVRPLELERRQDRDHGVHRHRCLALAGHLDQGHHNGAGPTT